MVSLRTKFLVVIGINMMLACGDPAKPTREAREWADSMGMKDASVNCAAIDSDGDGYVSCTVANKEQSGTKLISIQCASAMTGCMNEGCKLTVPFPNYW